MITYLFFTIITSFPLLYVLYKSVFGNVDYHVKISGGDIVSRVLNYNNIKQVFTLTGGHISPILVGCEKLGVKVIDVRNEATAVFAADAVSRVSKDDQIGIAIVTAGPGVTNCITPLRNAQLAQSPLILIGGSSPLLLKGRGSLQDVEQIGLLKNVCKKVYTCSRFKDISNVVQKAINIAKSGVPGPVFVEIPIDLLYPIQEIVKNSGANKPSKNFFQKLVQLFIHAKIKYYFSNNNSIINKTAFTHYKTKEISYKLEKTTINKFVSQLSASKKPVAIISSQIMNIPKIKISELVNNLKRLNIPMFCSGSTRGILGNEKWELEFRHKRRNALKEADFIFLLGVSCDFRLDYGRILNRKATIVSVNESKKDLTLNKGIFWNGHTILMSTYQFLKSIPFNNIKLAIQPWIDTLKTRENLREEEILIMSKTKPKAGINPLELCKKIADNVQDNKTIIVLDGGDFCGSAAYIVRPNGPLKWLDPGPFGTLGCGAGFALGAKACYPDHQVIIFWGDGASGYSIVEMDTFKRHNLPVLGIVGNDACWSQIKRDQVKILNSKIACDLEYSKYEMIAHCFDCEGKSIKNIDELNDAIFDYNVNHKNKNPYIMNVSISKTNFREGSISV